MPFTPSDDDVREARVVIEELNAAAAPALARRQFACEEIVRACEAGELDAFYLESATGSLKSMPRDWWRGTHAHERFEKWKVDYKLPRSDVSHGKSSCSWLYVGRESLAAFIRPKKFNKFVTAGLAHETATAELAARLRADAQWELGATLLWIGLRDLTEVARPIEYWKGWPNMQSGFLVAMAHSYIAAHAEEGEHVFTARPDEELVGALRRADLTATGMFRGTEARRAIPALDWYDLVLTDGPKALVGGQACAFGPGQVHGVTQTNAAYWTRLLFPRDEVLRLFPALDAALETATPVGSGSETWRVRPGEMQKAWIFRAEVVGEAERQRKRGSEASLCEALAQMAQASGYTWSASSIAAARRRGR